MLNISKVKYFTNGKCFNNTSFRSKTVFAEIDIIVWLLKLWKQATYQKPSEDLRFPEILNLNVQSGVFNFQWMCNGNINGYGMFGVYRFLNFETKLFSKTQKKLNDLKIFHSSFVWSTDKGHIWVRLAFFGYLIFSGTPGNFEA